MAKFISQGDTIEGDSVGIQVRKWTPSALVFFSPVKKRMYRYSSSRNSSAVIKKVHIVANDPEIIKATKDYHRGVGDELECSGMKVYVDCPRRVKVVSDEGATHTHGAIFVTTDKHTVAMISVPLSCLLKVIAEKEQVEAALKESESKQK